MHMIKVEPYSGGTPSTYRCAGCGKRVTDSQETVWADLDGVPFEAYYCTPCMRSGGDGRSGVTPR